MARPSEYTQELADRICELTAEGQFLKDICAREEMPAVSTVIRWRADRPEFDRHYQLALEAMGQALLKQALDIADDCSGDVAGDEGEVRRGAYVGIQRAKLRIDVRFRVVSKLMVRRCIAQGRRECPAMSEEPDWEGPIEIEYAE